MSKLLKSDFVQMTLKSWISLRGKKENVLLHFNCDKKWYQLNKAYIEVGRLLQFRISFRKGKAFERKIKSG